jgi:hypothetical protein
MGTAGSIVNAQSSHQTDFHGTQNIQVVFVSCEL